MGWSIGFDDKWQRDIGYGVPASIMTISDNFATDALMKTRRSIQSLTIPTGFTSRKLTRVWAEWRKERGVSR